MVLFFSGTGNSRYAAELIAMMIDDEVVSINELIKNKSKSALKSEGPLVFVAPIYGGRIPRIVDDFIRETTFGGNQNAYFFVTCADSASKCENYAKKLCQKKGLTFLGLHSVVMPGNNIAMMDTGTDAENEKSLADALQKIKVTAENIKSTNPLPPEKTSGALMSAVLNPLMYATMMGAKHFCTTAACTCCGQCVIRCPLNNIQMVNSKPKWGKHCTHCMACIGGCPARAVEYGKKTAGRNRYYNTKTPKL